MPWAQLLRRVFFIDALRYPRCSGAMVILAFLSDPPVVTRILRHLRLPTVPPPVAPARGSRCVDLWGLDPGCEVERDHPAADLPELSEDGNLPETRVSDAADALTEVRPP